MGRFSLSIERLENGWAELLLLLDGQEIIFYFKHVPIDAFYSLLESAIKIIGGMDSTVVFPNMSQRVYLSIKKLENCLCRIEIEQTSLDLSVKQFCRAILRMFDTYTLTFSRDEYSINLHKAKEYPWGQRVIRFYDPDFHIIEVGESMGSVFEKFYNQGMSIEDVAKRTMHPVEFVKSILLR